MRRREVAELLFALRDVQLAYAAYLINPFVAIVTHRALRDRLTDPATAMAVLLPLDVVLTFACAAVLHLAVERPFMRLRPRQ